jgi:hypothetical protein
MRDEYDEHLFGSLRQRSPAPCWLIFTRNCSKKLREASLLLDDFHMMRLRELIEKPG